MTRGQTVRVAAGALAALALAGCVGSNMPEAGAMDAGFTCEQLTPMLDDPNTPMFPVMDLGPCMQPGEACMSMANCMSGRAPREWMCNCETQSQRWVCGVTMYCTMAPVDAAQ